MGSIRNIQQSIKMIDEKTSELLAVADVLEEYDVNVKLDNGRYLNPVSTIRTKVDIIWDETLLIKYNIVTCDKCIHHNQIHGNDWCKKTSQYVKPENYCCWGERKSE